VRLSVSVLLTALSLLGCEKPNRDARGIEYPSSVTPALPVAPPARATTALSAPSPPPLVAPIAPPTSSKILAPSSPGFGRSKFAGDAPIVLERASRDGHWVALCTARDDSDGDGRLTASAGARGELHGDAFERYLLTPEEELRIDGILGADASGRYALLTQGGALLLWDAQLRKSLDLSALGADTRLSAESFAELRTVDFDRQSQRILYVRREDGGPRLVIRNLADGREQRLDPGPGAIWRARFDRGSAFAVVELVAEDSNKNGRLDFPTPILKAPRPCSASPGRYHTFVDRGDRPITVLVPLNGGAPIRDPDLVMPVGDALLLRDANGALLLSRAGKKRLLEPAACKGRIVHADAERELFVVGCAQKKTGHVSLELWTRGERKPLDIELSSVELDREVSDAPRLIALYPGLETMLLDADRRELLPLKTSDVVLATQGARALIRRGSTLLFYDADSRSEELLPVTLERYPLLLSTPPFVFVSPALVNLDSGALVGRSDARPLALSSEGQLLLSDTEADGARVARGPLHWETPSL